MYFSLQCVCVIFFYYLVTVSFELFHLCCCFAHSMVTDITKGLTNVLRQMRARHNDTLTHTFGYEFTRYILVNKFHNYGAYYVLGCFVFCCVVCELPCFDLVSVFLSFRLISNLSFIKHLSVTYHRRRRCC